MFKRKKKEAEVVMISFTESGGVRKLSKGYKLYAQIEYEQYGPIDVLLTLKGKKLTKAERHDCRRGYLNGKVTHVEAIKAILNAFDEKVYNETKTLLQIDIDKAFGLETEKKVEDDGLTIG